MQRTLIIALALVAAAATWSAIAQNHAGEQRPPAVAASAVPPLPVGSTVRVDLVRHDTGNPIIVWVDGLLVGVDEEWVVLHQPVGGPKGEPQRMWIDRSQVRFIRHSIDTPPARGN